MAESDGRMERLEAFRTRNHSLRVSASRISAMTGFHPFAVLPELLMTLVYQGGQELLEHDARLLGIQIRSEEAVLMELANKASTSTATALKSALQVKKGKRVLGTVHVADQVKEKVLKEAKSSKKLNAEEMKTLQEGVRSSVDTGFGTCHEEEALDLYERQCGWEVRERNATIMAWPFCKAGDTVAPMSEATRARTLTSVASSATAATSTSIGDNDDNISMNDNTSVTDTGASNVSADEQQGDDSGGAASIVEPDHSDENTPPSIQASSCEKDDCGSASDKSATNVKVPETKDAANVNATERPASVASSSRPFFTIYGAVDGIRDELWCPPSGNSNNDTTMIEEEWKLQQVIVECKHRMRRSFHSPPLYDQIQTTAYCLMYQVDDADIVQVMRNPKPSSTSKVQKINGEETVAGSKPKAMAD
jgi:hypothetical protein